jgi:hypothetical protein
VPLFVAYMTFKEGASTAEGMQAYMRRLTFTYPERATLLGEYWVNGSPQVVVIWEAEDEGPGDLIEASWADLFDVRVFPASRPQLSGEPQLPG